MDSESNNSQLIQEPSLNNEKSFVNDEDKSDSDSDDCNGRRTRSISVSSSEVGSEDDDKNVVATNSPVSIATQGSRRSSTVNEESVESEGSVCSQRTDGSHRSEGSASSKASKEVSRRFDNSHSSEEERKLNNNSSANSEEESTPNATSSDEENVYVQKGFVHKCGDDDSMDECVENRFNAEQQSIGAEKADEENAINNKFNQADEILPELSSDSDSECLQQDSSDSQQQKETLHMKAVAFQPHFGEDLLLLKMPYFLMVEPREYTRDNYEPEHNEKPLVKESEREKTITKITTKIRWRQVEKANGAKELQSNARFVTWSDGSSTLHVGDKIFDVTMQLLPKADHHLFLREGAGMQACHVFKEQMLLHAHAPASNVAFLSNYSKGTKFIDVTTKDPVAERLKALREEKAKLREKPSHSGVIPRRLRASRLSSSLHSEEDGNEIDDDCISLGNIKEYFKKKGRSYSYGQKNSSTSEQREFEASSDSDLDIKGRRSLMKSKPTQPLPESDSDS